MTRVPHITTVLAVVALSSSSIVKPPSAGGNFELLILHNNDMHAKFEQTSQLSGTCTPADREKGKCYGGFPRVAHVVKEARKAAASGEGPPVLYLNAGDTYTGTVWFTIYKWKVAAEFLNALQPDAVCLGNHEFDEGVEGLIPFIRNLSSPIVTANLLLDKVPELSNIANLHNSIVITKNGVRIGIIGYVTPETKFLAPINNVEYEDEIISLNREVKKLKELGIQILIALGHSGFLKDLEIAEKVDDIDLVIGGHSNTFLTNSNDTDEVPEHPQGPYPTLVQQKSGRKVLVVQAYAYTKYLGKLHIFFNGNGEIIKYDGYPILLNNDIPQDPEVLEIVKRYQTDIDEINNEVVGTSATFLNGDNCRYQECNMGNFLTDAAVNHTKEYKSNSSKSYIAIIQGGRIRLSLHSPYRIFNITRGEIIAVVPYTDTLCILTMNGAVLKLALEHSVASWRLIDTPGQFLQYSGVQVAYDLAQKVGSRTIKAKALCSNCTKLTDIEDNYKYQVITSIFIADGGDGYDMFKILPRDILPYNEVVCAIDSLKKYSPIQTGLYSRIILENKDKVESIPIPDVYLIPSIRTNIPSDAVVLQSNTVLFYLLRVVLIYLCV